LGQDFGRKLGGRTDTNEIYVTHRIKKLRLGKCLGEVLDVRVAVGAKRVHRALVDAFEQENLDPALPERSLSHEGGLLHDRSFVCAQKHSGGWNLVHPPVCDAVWWILPCEFRTAAGASAVAAVITTTVARHDGSAFSAQRRVGDLGRKLKFLLRVRFC